MSAAWPPQGGAPSGTPSRGEAILEARGLCRVFEASRGFFGRRRGSSVRAVDGVDLTIGAGEVMALVGESGCGKSTLGRMLIRVLEPTAGSIRYKGRDITALQGAALRALRREFQMVFQDPYDSLNPRMPVAELIAEPLRLAGRPRQECRTRVLDLLDQVGLPRAYASRYARQFSGGQRQRIGIARALALSPEIVVCDEPVSALDVSIQAQIVNLLQDLQQRLRLSYLFISHDLRVVRHIADRVAVMYLGRVVEQGDKDEVFRQPRHPYARALLDALPGAGRRPGGLVIRGELSPVVDGGCAFRPRCLRAQPRCAERRPEPDPADRHPVACHFPLDGTAR